MLNFLKSTADKQTPDQQDNQILGGRYQVIRRLAAGGFGQTFLARDRHLPGHPVCVVKQLKPRFSDEASLKTARRLFDTEAQVLYDLGHHPQIPRLMAHFEQDQEFYLAQDYIDGEPLDAVLADGRPWEPERVVALLEDILQVLAFVHEKNVIHRDIKPSNLLCRREDGRIVLIDFGAVKQVNTGFLASNSGRTNLTVSIGTQGYMPSEQLSGQPRFSSDIYAVGMIGIQALTGVRPQDLTEDPQTGEVAWRLANPAVSDALDNTLADVLDRMVYYDFRTRYATATAALMALENLPPALRDRVPERWYVPHLSPTPDPDTASSHGTQPEDGGIPDSSSQPTEMASRPYGGTVDLSEISLGPTAMPPRSRATLTARRSRVIAGLAGLAALAGLGGLAWGRLVQPLAQETAVVETVPPSSEAGTAESSTSPAPEVVPLATEATSASALLTQASQLRQDEQYSQALARYEEAIAAEPNSTDAHWGKCYSLNRLEQPQAAIAACDRALALDPDHADALSSKGYALQLQGLDDAALVLFNQAVASEPNHVDALTNRGTALLALEQPQAALDSFDRAIALQPNMPEAWNNRAAALWQLSRHEAAVASVEKALSLKPDYAEAQTLRQQMRDRLGY